MKAILALASLAMATGATAQPRGTAPQFQDGEGRAWRSVPTETGVLLTTRGANIHLNRACVAASSRYGTGRWEWANGGFAIVFDNVRIGFPRQEIDLGQGQNCRG